ncbi:hypothetical protein [Terricaulis silvestris]|uniref:Uncharacterized protein n=1 Tax=Terricaulis silvestris TaxID=2686094 RepID=A0A6I6MI18_9CAUL|nr:hypothetical protein [Terricaulis silvestris]QGZ93331.1 hypothetical protein DSM104635_00141 [Terricaulis silvestris]
MYKCSPGANAPARADLCPISKVVAGSTPSEDVLPPGGDDDFHPCRCPTCLAGLTKIEWLRPPHFLYEIVVEPMEDDANASGGEAFSLVQDLRYTLPADRPDLVRFIQGRERGDGHTTTMVTLPSCVDEFESFLEEQLIPALTALGWRSDVMATRRNGSSDPIRNLVGM